MEQHDLNAPLNTQTLQKTYPDIYCDFLSSCDYVFSAPGTFSWCGDIATRFGGLGCAQQIPRRVYMGIKAGAPALKGIRFTTAKIFENGHWTTIPIVSDLEALHKELGQYLLASCPKLAGAQISFLYEFNYGRGLSTSSAAGAALALAIASIQSGSPEFATKLATLTPLHRFITDQAVAELLRRAWQIHCIMCVHIGGYTEVAASLFHHRFPILTATAPRFDVLEHPFNRSKSLTDLPDDRARDIMAWRLDEFFTGEDQSSLQWPIDISVVHLGKRGERDHFVKFLAEQRSSLQKLVNITIPQHVRDQTWYAHLLNFILPVAKDDPWQHYLSLLNTISLTLIHGLWDILTTNLYAKTSPLADAIRKYQETLQIIFGEHRRVDEFLTELLIRAWKTGDPLTAKINRNIDSVLVVGPLGSLENLFPSLLETLKGKIPGTATDWCSWRDGFETDGARIEHAPNFGVVHQLAAGTSTRSINGGYSITIYAGDGKTEHRAMRQLDSAVADIFLDEVREKVWCAGKPVSAEELPSQRMAIMLLKQLAASDDNRVANIALPRSSYTSYRNELQSKVIGPLRKLVDKRLHKQLELGIEGSLTQFHVVRNKDEVTIAIREK